MANRTGTAWRTYLDLIQQAGAAWVDDRAPTMGAALAFYSAFALAPLLIVLIAAAGAIFGPDAARGAIAGQLTGLVGAAAAQAIQDLLKAAQQTTTGAVATIVGLVTTLFSLAATTVLFAMLYKWLPSVFIAWPDVWIGAFITAVLFTVGRFGIGVYLGRSAIASAYGAAGTLVVLLLWLYYSAQVFLLGAEFTCLYAKHRSSRDDGVMRIESGLQQQQSQRRSGDGTSKG